MLDILKSENDEREYKLITLPNKMRCLLISDMDCDMAAAAINVHVGSSLDQKSM